MTLDEYQKRAMGTAIENNGEFVGSFLHRVLGLVGEAGEVAEKVKKIIRDKDSKINAVDKNEIAKELGDVLWYIQATADYLGFSLEEIAQGNLDKLYSRRDRNQIHGAGDNR